MTINDTSTVKKEYEPVRMHSYWNNDTSNKMKIIDSRNWTSSLSSAAAAAIAIATTTRTPFVMEKIFTIGSMIIHKINNTREIVTVRNNATMMSPFDGTNDCIRPACDGMKSMMKQMENYQKEKEQSQQQKDTTTTSTQGNSNDNNNDNNTSKTKTKTKTDTETETNTSTNTNTTSSSTNANDDNTSSTTNHKSNHKKQQQQQQQQKLQCPPTSTVLGNSSWTLLHSMVAWYPEKPNNDDIQSITQFFNSLARFYPCPYCAQDFQQSIKEIPIRPLSRVDLCQWLCEQHNIVNDKLGKSIFPCDIKSLDKRWRNNPKC